MEKEIQDKVEKLHRIKQNLRLRQGDERVAKHREKGKLTAWERLDALLDPGSFVELNSLAGHNQGLPGDGVIAGHGTIDDKPVCIYSQDATVLGGSIGNVHGAKMYRTVERAIEMGVPLIGLHDSAGARTHRPDSQMFSVIPREEKNGSSIFYPNTQASGLVPQIAAILGACAGISVYSPALTDFIYMVDGLSQMFITGPRIVKSVMGEDVTMEDLGGARIHARVSGVCDFRVKSELDCFQSIRKLLSYLPPNWKQNPADIETGDDPDRLDDEIGEIIPADPHKFYDMKKIIRRIVDNGEFIEVKAEFAQEMITCFGRMGGQSVGIVANQPMVRAGALTVDSSDKEARFIRFCDAFNVPLVFLIDTPAYMPGTRQEHAGIIRHGAKVLFALCEETVPRVHVVLRKSYGGGNLGMGVNPGLGQDFVFYWPTTEIGVLGAEQAVELFYAEDLRKSDNPKALEAQLIKQYREKYTNPYNELSVNPFIDEIIEPRETRQRLIKALRFLKTKRRDTKNPKRHGNIPL